MTGTLERGSSGGLSGICGALHGTKKGGISQHVEVDNGFLLNWIIASIMLVQIAHHLFVLCLQRCRNPNYARFKSHYVEGRPM